MEMKNETGKKKAKRTGEAFFFSSFRSLTSRCFLYVFVLFSSFSFIVVVVVVVLLSRATTADKRVCGIVRISMRGEANGQSKSQRKIKDEDEEEEEDDDEEDEEEEDGEEEDGEKKDGQEEEE